MMFYRLFTLLLLLSAVACYNPLYLYQQKERGTDDAMLYTDVAFLAHDDQEGRATGTKGERTSAKYIAERMRRIGLEPAGEGLSYLQSFDFSGNPHVPQDETSTGIGYNVLGFMDNPGESVIVIGGHYDHLGHGGFGSLHVGEPAIHNGADDNASGIAVMLWLAEKLQDSPIQSDILFIAFSGEEYGLLGSNYFTKSVLGANHKYKFMINMDMVGRLDEMRGVAINGVGTSPIWNIVIGESNIDNLKIVSSESGSGASDHSSFYHNDIPVLHFFTGQHADYHKPSDDTEKINFDGMEKVAQLILGIVENADEFHDMRFTKTKDIDRTSMSFKVTMGVMPDYLFDGKGMRIDGVLEDRPAKRAGLLKGDIVIQMGDHIVEDINSYMEALNQHEPGQEVTVRVKRGSEEKSVLLKF